MKDILNSFPPSPHAKIAKGTLLFMISGGSKFAAEKISIKRLMKKSIVDSLLETRGKGPEDTWPDFVPFDISLP